jgi:hypothetical protein
MALRALFLRLGMKDHSYRNKKRVVGSDARELAVFTYDVMVSPPPTILGLEV